MKRIFIIFIALSAFNHLSAQSENTDSIGSRQTERSGSDRRKTASKGARRHDGG